ncbi:Non-specific serine/threonine protein kinase [Bertholletia excelsa]
MLGGDNGELEVSGGRTLVVGVKLDSPSRELLTWTLVKAAQPGDRVFALHVVSDNETVDRDGKSSFLSLVKSFDSVLAVYEGFCNLKQVDLKLKICRGSSIRKVLVQEAKSCLATDVIVGTSQNHHTIRSSASVAKYCARKLRKACSVLAVNNGKVVFHKEASPMNDGCAKGIDGQHRHHLLSKILRSLNKNTKILHGANVDENLTVRSDRSICGDLELASMDQGGKNLELALVKSCSDCAESSLKLKCSVCCPDSFLLENSSVQSAGESSHDGNEGNSSSNSLLTTELPELRPGSPLRDQAVLSDGVASDVTSPHISAVQKAKQFLNGHCLPSMESIENSSEEMEDRSSELDGESGAVVPVTSNISAFSSPSSSRSLAEELEGLHEKFSESCRLFKYQELLEATSNFIPENLIGEGGNSQVYKGHLADGKDLAVKILKPSEDALKEFMLEIEIITALHHKNIISLVGFCHEDGHLLLVYDFLSRGSVEENLHGNKKDACAFGWSERYKVAVGVAEALAYLHSATDKPVIHRDIKSSNILLSDMFEPQLSDFGLAKWALASSSHITCTNVAGTFGYLAPEYFMYGKVNEKVDVYAFGVVLLELLSGRKPISNDHPKGQESLVLWAKPILNGGKVAQLLDPSLVNDYDHDQLEKMVLAAKLCLRRAPRARPSMSIVLKILQGDSEATKWARLQVNTSEGNDMQDDEAFPRSNLQSYLNLALLDLEEDSLSVSSIEQSVSLEEYLRGRWSRSSSFFD